MSSVTVGELWRLALPSESTLVAGEAGLGSEVSWPATLRTRPPAFQSLKGGEILLIALENLRLLDPSLSLSRLLQAVIRVGVAGVVVSGEVEAPARELAEREKLPLFQIPETVNLGDLERAIIRAIVDYRNELHQRAQDIYRRVMELAIEGRGVSAIVEELATSTGRIAVLEDEGFNVAQLAVPPGLSVPPDLRDGRLTSGREAILRWLQQTKMLAAEPPAAEFPIDGAPFGRLVAPVITRQGVRGYLSLLDGGRPFGEIDRVSLVRGAAACAIEVARELAVEEAADRAQGTFIDDLLAGRIDSPAAIRTRARRLRIDADAICVALALQTSPDRATSLAAALERESASGRLTFFVRAVDDQITALLSVSHGTDERALKTMIAEFHRRLGARLVGTPVSVGVGRPRDKLEDFSASHAEATGALQLGIQLFGPGTVTYFADLGIYRLLLALRDKTELRTFYEETLGKLAEHDRRSDGELLRTLEAYFACHASPTEAAERLHVHRNTLLYRLGKIRAISGLDFDDPETRLALQLGLHVRRILYPTEAQSQGRARAANS